MKEITYERPREKLLRKGVSALSNSELLQVIIGSGNAGMPVTKIARKVDKVLKAKGVEVKIGDLMTVQGLGAVKAGQIIAGIEHTVRMTYQEHSEGAEDSNILSDLYVDVKNAKKPTLLYAFFDGGGRLIDDQSRNLGDVDTSEQIIRRIFAEALSQSTASITVILGFNKQSLEPTMYELGFARELYRTSRLLAIAIRSFTLVNETAEYSLKEALHG